MTRTLLIVLLIGAGAGVTWYFLQPATATTETPAARTMEVKKGELVETAAATGVVEPNIQVDVKSRTSGEVVEVLVEEGQTVKQGDVLFRLDPIDAEREVERTRIALERLKSQLAESRASLSIARYQAAEARADKTLNDEGRDLGVIAQTTQRQSSAQARIASATVQQRLASIGTLEAQIKAAELDVAVAERRLSETKIVAPFSGTVLSVGVEKGAIVASGITNISGGTALMTLADLSDLRVIGALDQAQVGKVKVGQEVRVRVDAYPDKVFAGQVERVAPLGKNVSNIVTFDVEIRVTDKEQALLRSGMSADIEIVAQRLQDVLMVPLTAIVSRGPDRFVKLADGNEKKVETGPTDGGRIVIKSGLEAGERIQVIAASPRATAQQGSSGGMFPMGGGGGGGRRPRL